MVPIIVVSVLMFTFVLLCCLFAGTQTLREKLALCLCRKLMQKLDAKLAVNTELSIQQILEVEEGCSQKERIKRDIVASGEAYCPICLERKSNVLGQCGHAFHLECLWEWVNRKGECPLCKSHAVDKIEVYCKRCLKPCFKLPSLRRISRLKMMELKEIRCVGCLK